MAWCLFNSVSKEYDYLGIINMVSLSPLIIEFVMHLVRPAVAWWFSMEYFRDTAWNRTRVPNLSESKN